MMPYCPKCKYEYHQGIVKCPDCGAELVQQLEPTPVRNASAAEDSFVPLVVPSADSEMWIIKNLLEAADIPVLIRSDETTLYRTYRILASDATVCVPSSRLAEAREILQDAQASSNELNWEVWNEDAERETGV